MDMIYSWSLIFAIQNKDYLLLACIDPLGNEMKIGDSRRLSNGTVIMHCAISGGVLKKVVEKGACLLSQAPEERSISASVLKRAMSDHH